MPAWLLSVLSVQVVESSAVGRVLLSTSGGLPRVLAVACNVGGRTIYGIPFANNLQRSNLLLVLGFLGIVFCFSWYASLGYYPCSMASLKLFKMCIYLRSFYSRLSYSFFKMFLVFFLHIPSPSLPFKILGVCLPACLPACLLFIWFWCQSNSGFLECIWKDFLRP